MSDTPLTSVEAAARPNRRRYSLAFKREVVEASFVPGVSAAHVARQHGLNGNLLHTWRWHYRSGLLGPTMERSMPAPESLIPVQVGDTPVEGDASVSRPGLTIRFGQWHIALQGELDPAVVQLLLRAVVG